MSGAADPIIWHHTSVVVADIDRAVSFYRDQFGFQVSLESRLAAQIQQLLALPDITCDLVQVHSPISGHVLELIEFSNVRRAPIVAFRSGRGWLIWPSSFSTFRPPCVRWPTQAEGPSVGSPIVVSPAVYCWTPAGTVVELEQWHDLHQAEARR